MYEDLTLVGALVFIKPLPSLLHTIASVTKQLIWCQLLKQFFEDYLRFTYLACCS